MTRVQLLKNLNESKITSLMCYKYKVITETKDYNAHSIYIMVSNQVDYPIYLLKYRLDIDFLANLFEIGSIRIHGDDLKAFEVAGCLKK